MATGFVTVKKKEKYSPGEFGIISKPGYTKLINSTQKKNTIILWTLLAMNKNDFNMNIGRSALEGLCNVNSNFSKGVSDSYEELKKLGFINDKDEFNEDGWEEKKEESLPSISSVEGWNF